MDLLYSGNMKSKLKIRNGNVESGHKLMGSILQGFMKKAQNLFFQQAKKWGKML